MAAPRSPCGGFKTRVLHFKVKNTTLKEKIAKRMLKCNQDSEVFAEFSGTFCTLWAKKITFLKGNICIYKCFIDVLYIFYSVLKKNQKKGTPI